MRELDLICKIWICITCTNVLSFLRAKQELDSHIVITENWDEFYSKLDHKNVGCPISLAEALIPFIASFLCS